MAKQYKPVLDQFENEIPAEDIARLKQEVAAPSAMGSRPPFAGHLAFDIDPRRLGAIIRAADNGQTRDWFIIAEELEELYTHYLAVLSKRKRQVTALPITVEDADDSDDAKRAGDLIREWLDTETLEHALFDIADGIGKGYSVNELMWETTPEHFWPVEIHWRNQRDFEVSWNDGQTLWLRDNAGFLPLYPHKFLLHRHAVKSGNPVRSSLTRAVAWKWLYATYNEKDWALFVQGYGLPVRLGRYGPEASDGDKRTLWRAVRGIAGDLAAIIPKSMEMEFVEAKAATQGAELFTGRANWLNMEVSKLVLGGVAGTDAVKGSHAVGQEHRSAEQDVEKFDARLLSTSVNRQVVPEIVAFTLGPQKKYPRIRIGQDEVTPVSDLIAAAADLGPLGFKMRAADMYDRLQVTEPKEGEAVIGVPAPATNPDGSPIVGADTKIKANPHPEINPNSDTRAMLTAWRAARQARHQGLLGRLLAMQTPQSQTLLEALEDRLQREAQGALGGMTGQIRAAYEKARDMPHLAELLREMKLDDKQFAQAMTQGLVLAHLTGQAALLDELGDFSA